jgi:hypothetical protein
VLFCFHSNQFPVVEAFHLDDEGNTIVLVLVNSAKDEYNFSASSVKCWGRLLKLNDSDGLAYARAGRLAPHQRGIFGKVFSVQVDS